MKRTCGIKILSSLMDLKLKPAYYLVLLFAITTTVLLAQNQMDLMNTFYGEFNGSRFGSKILAMDYNCDGYDDLIVHAPYWNPNGVYDSMISWGKLYFFWGGPNMDNMPDFVMQGTFNWELFGGYPLNGGDINADGRDDLLIGLRVNTANRIAIYYATANPTGIPDLIISAPYTVGSGISAWPLGDINGDGRADLVIDAPPFGSNTHKLIIWTGVENPFVTLVETSNGLVAWSATGLGDVNGDSIDDYLLQYGISGGTNMNSRIILYYGDTDFPAVDSLVISDNTNAITIRQASPLGDLNNDGYADFESYVGKVWFGGTDLTPNNDFNLIYDYPGHEWMGPSNNTGNPFISGDLNGDGYDDVIGSTSELHYYTGEVGIWMGGPNMDGLIDLYLYPPVDYHTRQYGWSKTTGDFNDDGLCDLAVAAPMYYAAPQWAEGRVYIYSGNTALTDTIVANDDQIEANPGWEFNVYPNPLRENEQLKVDLLGTGNKANKPLRLELFNLKGQKICSTEYPLENFKGTISMPVPDSAHGIYILRIAQQNNTIITKKICVFR